MKKRKKNPKQITCPYCGRPAQLRKANEVYEKKTDEDAHLFVCSGYPACDSYVTANHKLEPRGTLANAELRLLRREAHRIFDLIWKKQLMSQTQAYFWLQSMMQLPSHLCHIGQMNERQCRDAIQHSRKMLENRGVYVYDWKSYEERVAG